MPISSGALEWPVSYYSKPEKETREVVDGEQSTPRGTAPQSYQWQPQLTNREDYEKWRKKMDRKINRENEDPTKGEQRDSPREIIRRHRRRRCCLLGLVVSLISLIVMAVFIFVFLRYTGHEIIGPEDLIECTGQWRSHYLAYADSSNGTTAYFCCYIPDMKNNTVWNALGKSGWPDGFLVPQNECPAPSKDCEDYKPNDFTQVRGSLCAMQGQQLFERAKPSPPIGLPADGGADDLVTGLQELMQLLEVTFVLDCLG